ncbi:MAG: hypothetical protein ACP5GF_12620, partial [Thiomonas sp.]
QPGWGSIAGRLVRYGHRWGDIQDYTLAQCLLFLREGQQAEMEQMKVLLPVIRVAVNGEQKDVKQLIEGLSHG